MRLQQHIVSQPATKCPLNTPQCSSPLSQKPSAILSQFTPDHIITTQSFHYKNISSSEERDLTGDSRKLVIRSANSISFYLETRTINKFILFTPNILEPG